MLNGMMPDRWSFEPPDPRRLPAPAGELYRRQHRVQDLLARAPGLEPERRAEVVQEILLHGLEAVPVVRTAAFDRDGAVAALARAALRGLAPQEIGAHLAAGLAQDETGYPLELGAALLARLDDPNLPVKQVLREVDALGKRAARFIATALDAVYDEEARQKRLLDIIFQLGEFWRTEGFRGHVEDYSDVKNVWLPQVLAQRTGLPIMLSVLYLALCRRLGLEAHGIGLPWHFIVRMEVALKGGSGYVLVDPYHGARPLDLDDCRKLVESGGQQFDPDNHLRPVSPREVLVRICHNLLAAFDQHKEVGDAERVATVLVALAPQDPVGRLIRAERRMRLGAFREASQDLRALLNLEPPAALAQAALGLLRQIEYEHSF